MDILKSPLFTTPIAHRGLHNDEFPENSIGAYMNAIANGFPIEIDVRMSDDREPVVFHDSSLSRMTKRDGYVCNLQLKELASTNLVCKDGKQSDYTIPTFEQVLSTIDGKVPLLVEIKNEGCVGVLEKKVIAMLREYGHDNFAVQSFNPYSLEYFKNNADDITRGILSCNFERTELKNAIKRYMLSRLKLNKMCKPHFVSYRWQDIPNKYVSRAALPTLVWTVRNNSEMERMLPHCNNFIFENFIPNKK